MTDVFGLILEPADVENAVQGLLKFWMETYLRDRERKTGRTKQLPAVRSWGFTDVEERLDEQQPPFIAVECAEATMRTGAQSLGAAWETTIAVVTKSDKSMTQARRLSQIYGTACGLILTQQTLSIGEAYWEKQSYGMLAAETRRFLAHGQLTFTITVPVVAEIDAGPETPAPNPEEPPGEYPTVQEENIIIDPE
jgi:hypothetical protein